MDRMAARVDELQAWIDCRRLETKFAEAGLRGLLAELKRRKPSGAQLVSTLHKSIYQARRDVDARRLLSSVGNEYETGGDDRR